MSAMSKGPTHGTRGGAMLRPLSIGWLAAGALMLSGGFHACLAQTTTPSSRSAREGGALAPVTINVCGKPQTYTSIPQRAVTHDVNITEMFLFLGLADKLVGYSGISSSKEIAPEWRSTLQKLPNLSSQAMNMETIVGARADFVFAGWSYGFRQGAITPDLLSRYGIDSYVLTESCIRIAPRDKVELEDSLLDLRNIARIFRIADTVEPRIQTLERGIHDLSQKMKGVTTRPTVFVYDSGQAIPVTVGRFGMPRAMIDAAGGKNIFDDIESNWPRGNWEDVIERDPEWIVVVDYGVPSAQGKIDFLKQKPELAGVKAIRKQQFFVITYAQATPSPSNVPMATELAKKLHPEAFKARTPPPARP